MNNYQFDIMERCDFMPLTAELASMYSLYESCKMNNLNFGRYIEDILTRMKDGDKDYKSMLPCYYVEKSEEVKECA